MTNRRGAVAQSSEGTASRQEITGLVPLGITAPYLLGRCQYNVTG